jgi:hypothetical protein
MPCPRRPFPPLNNRVLVEHGVLFQTDKQVCGRYQSKFVYFAKTSKPDFAAIDFPEFLSVDLSGPLAAPSI